MSKENEMTEDENIEEALVEAVEDSVKQDQQREKSMDAPSEVYIIPLTRRPFFPGMAAPIVIEPGAYYEVLKTVAKTEHKCMGLFLTNQEDVNIYKIGFEDLYEVGVLGADLPDHPDGAGRGAGRPQHGKEDFDRQAVKSANISRPRSNTMTISPQEASPKS